MTDRTMRPALYLAALTALASTLSPTAAQAQAINANMTIYITPEGGEEEKLDNGSNVYISQAQCNGNWRIVVQGYSVTVPVLELWTANSQSTNCADQANRNSANNSQTICWGPKARVSQVNGKETFNVKGSDLFSRDGGSCDAAEGNKYKIQFVTLDSQTQPMTSTVTASNNNPNQISAILTLYTTLPEAPGNPKPRTGGRTLGIEWDKINNNALTEYRAFFDHDPNATVYDDGSEMDGGVISCGTGALTASGQAADGGSAQKLGGDVAVDNVTVFQSGTTKGSSISISGLDDKNIPYNTYTAVAVAAIDGADNIGYLSPPVCVKRVETLGYLDTCRGDGGVDCGDLDSCSLSPRNTGSAFWLSACTLALSAWARRRRRST